VVAKKRKSLATACYVQGVKRMETNEVAPSEHRELLGAEGCPQRLLGLADLQVAHAGQLLLVLHVNLPALLRVEERGLHRLPIRCLSGLLER
jgi:hypothetical protein